MALICAEQIDGSVPASDHDNRGIGNADVEILVLPDERRRPVHVRTPERHEGVDTSSDIVQQLARSLQPQPPTDQVVDLGEHERGQDEWSRIVVYR